MKLRELDITYVSAPIEMQEGDGVCHYGDAKLLVAERKDNNSYAVMQIVRSERGLVRACLTGYGPVRTLLKY